MTTLESICNDLEDEHRALDEILVPLATDAWDRPTPAPGWTVRDQISHLAFFDEVGAQAVAEPDRFMAQLEDISADPAGYMDRGLQRGRALDPDGVLGWWREARSRSIDVMRAADPDARIPWFGPPMKPISFVTGRLMETWAHGQDVVDALGIERLATSRLRHVAHMGVRARGFSFQVNDQPRPEEDVRVELIGPDGDTWAWGESSENVVRGDALDFCLVVSQRRHPLDTDLYVEGPIAQAWIRIAQSFAGPPGEGRRPGQFPRRRR
jgi:uncharacterized protein (TIGR03084 family)